MTLVGMAEPLLYFVRLLSCLTISIIKKISDSLLPFLQRWETNPENPDFQSDLRRYLNSPDLKNSAFTKKTCHNDLTGIKCHESLDTVAESQVFEKIIPVRHHPVYPISAFLGVSF